MSRILVGEPNTALGSIYRHKLEDAGHEVVLAETPDEIRAAIELYPFEVVFMDLIMYPGLAIGGPEFRDGAWTGAELVRELRHHPHACLATIGLFHVLPDKPGKLESLGLQAGADICMAKDSLSEVIETTLKFARMRAAS